MRAGRLDRRIKILEETITTTPEGAPSRAWAVVAMPWAEVIPVGGKERLQAPQTIAERTARFRIRYRPGVHESMRIEHDGMLWGITGIAEVGRREGLELTASAMEGQT